MKLITLLLFSIISYKSNSQIIKKTNKYEIFGPKICVTLFCGTYILKSDSTFTFLSININNTIKEIGYGTYRYKKNKIVEFTLLNHFSSILNNAEINYKFSSTDPFDSLIVKGRIVNEKNEPLKQAAAVYSNKYYAVTNDSGYFSATFRKLAGTSTLRVIPNNLMAINELDWYPETIISLSEYNNKHELEIKIKKIDSLTCKAVDPFYKGKPFTYEERLHYNKKDKGYGLFFLTNDIIDLKAQLILAKQSQPMLIYNIDEILRYLEN